MLNDITKNLDGSLLELFNENAIIIGRAQDSYPTKKVNQSTSKYFSLLEDGIDDMRMTLSANPNVMQQAPDRFEIITQKLYDLIKEIQLLKENC
jgi:hypothetical protein